MARKPRSDSLTAQQTTAAALDEPIISPIPLTEEETEIFDGLIEGLPRDKWDRCGIRMAARLARLECYLEELIDQVIMEGPVTENNRGTPVSNPLQTAMTTTSSTVKMLRTGLGLSASQRGITEKNTKAQKAQEKKTRAALHAVGGKGDLLA